MSQNASSSPFSGSSRHRWGLLSTSAAPPPTAAPKRPSRLFDLNKGATSANDGFDLSEAAVPAAASAKKVIQRVLGKGALDKVEAMPCEGRGRIELAPSPERDYDGDDVEDKLSERALEDEAWATNPSLYDCMDDCVVRRRHAISLPTACRGASKASTTGATAAAAAALTPPDPSSAVASAGGAAPAASIAATAAAVAAATCGTGASSLTTALYRHTDRMVSESAVGAASDSALAAGSEGYARPSSWYESTAVVKVTAAPSATVKALHAVTGAPTATTATILRSLSSSSPNFCAVGCVQPNACTPAALLAMSSTTTAAATSAAAPAPAAAPSGGSQISMATAANSDSLQQRLLHPVKYAGEGTYSSSEPQHHALPRASHRGISARQNLLQRGRIDSVLRPAAVAPTTSDAAGSARLTDSAPRTPSAQSPGFATPSLLSGCGFCHSADPLSQTFQQETPSVPSNLSSRASQKRKNQTEILLRWHSKTESLSRPLLQANNSCSGVGEVLESGDAAKALRSGEASEDGGRTGCADALRSRCPTRGAEGHICRECGKVFNSAQALGGHISSHVGLRRFNFLSELGDSPDAQRQPLVESSSSIRTEPVATPAFSATPHKESSSGLLYGAPHTSRGSGARALPISFVGRARAQSSSNRSTVDVVHLPTASLGPCHGIGSSSSSCRRLNQAKQPSAQINGQQQGSTAQGRPCPQTSVHMSQGSDRMCLQRSGQTRNNAAAATMPEKTSHGATAVQPYNPDFGAVTSSATPLSVASAAPAGVPLTPSALTAALWAFMAQQEGDDKGPSQLRKREKSSSPAGAAPWTHGGRATCESRGALGAAAMPHVHARQLGSHSGSDFRPASQTALSLAGIHQQCLQGFLGCEWSQPAIDSAGSEVPALEGGENTLGLDLKLGL